MIYTFLIMILESLYSDIDKARVEATLTALRKMRGAGQVALWRDEDPQPILRDAEELAVSPAPYLVHLLHQAQTPEMLQKWEETLRVTGERYRSFVPVRKRDRAQSLADIKTKLRIMSLNDLDGLTRHFLTDQNLGNLRFEELFDRELGILAPFSTDLLVASLLPEYIRVNHSENTPTVKPVLLSKRLELLAMPHDQEGRPALAGMRRVLPFVDFEGNGGTRLAVYLAAKTEYRRQVIPVFPY